MKRNLSVPELENLANQIGEFIQYWGFKRIHGRIWLHLYLSATPLDATTLTKRLKVSKALVSFSVHDLLEYGVIREVAKGPGRTVFYEANPDVTGVILNVLRVREQRMLASVNHAWGALASVEPPKFESALSPTRIAELKTMIDGAQTVLDYIIRTGKSENDVFGGLRSIMH